MKTKQSPKAKKAKLDRKEWCFDSIPKREIQACFNYEYAREFARQSKNTSPPYPAFYDWFPDTSWQALDQEVRSVLMALNYYKFPGYSNSLHIQTLRQSEATNVRIIELFRSVRGLRKEDLHSQTQYGFFEINWNHSDPAIKLAFAEWLVEQRKDRKKRGLTEIKYKRKRGGFRDRLRWLGALRVVQHYRTSQLVNYQNQDAKLKVAAPYRYSPDLYKCAKKARRQLDKLSHLMKN